MYIWTINTDRYMCVYTYNTYDDNINVKKSFVWLRPFRRHSRQRPDTCI